MTKHGSHYNGSVAIFGVLLEGYNYLRRFE